MNRMIAALFLCIVSAGAYAQASPQPAAAPAAPNPRMERAEQQLQSRFANANTTRDGKLTREQAAAGMPMVARHFDEIDTQRAGYITLPQIEAFMAKQMMSR
ncbi:MULTISPECIES: EF-hand domain-containing protein [Cupriavidus]|uniref:EF-hand domain-containing protein n=1 Tax=Cupriavidus pauculus TaxID=82633 RepID=A0A5P2HEM1_9BURK|nr:EF-hand domain-containing protein [Cupriavidus pauculus]QET05480.1 EF-hand domain-containing protein [Cupriavidus pauculus]